MDKEDQEHFRTIREASAKPSTGSKRPEARSTSGLDQDSCLTIAKGICGCYRRDEAQDPETFAAALAIVLMDYPADIVRVAADPRTGVITAFPMGLPNVGQIRQFLEDKLTYKLKIERLAALPRADFKRLGRPAPGPGDWANVFVPAADRNYPRMVEKAKTADVREYRYDQAVGHVGIWVSLTWLDQPDAVKSAFKVPSMTDIEALYARHPELGEGEAA